MTAALALDLLVAGLLVATIGYAIVLNRKLSRLRGGHAELSRLIGEFHDATSRAETGIAALKQIAGGPEGDALGRLGDLAKLREDLDYLIERADEQVVRLEKLIRESRGQAKAGPAPARGLAPDAKLDAELFGESRGGGRPRATTIQGMR